MIMNEILDKISSINRDAYIVGGYVRDKLLGIESFDIDICTNASIDEIINLFSNGTCFKKYYSYHIKDNKYHYDITCFRKELSYIDSKPDKIVLCDSIEEDAVRRDFTINALYMNKFGKIYDFYNGIDDIKNKVIRTIGKAKDRFLEDNTRIIRAIRLSICLDFELDNDIKEFIKSDNIKLLNNVKEEYIKREINKIKEFNKMNEFIKFINEYKLNKYFNFL